MQNYDPVLVDSLSYMNMTFTLCFTVDTVPIDRILSVKNARAWVSMDFT